MKDVAHQLGVHTTTVSLALRNSPRLPLETRQRIQALAKKMGYHQDPMLTALMAYRSNVATAKTQPTIAMIFDFQNEQEFDQAPPSYRNFLTGATSKAEELGYKIQRFFFEGPHRSAEGQRIGRILISRGITGVILSAFRPRTTSFSFDWDQFSVVQIENQHLALPLHMVSSDQATMAREAVRRLWAGGFRRIGMAVGREEEIYLDHAFTVGFHGEAFLHAGLRPAPPLLLANGQKPDQIGPVLRKWIGRYKIQAVISNWTTVSAALELDRTDRVSNPVLVILGTTPPDGPFGGMTQLDTVVGERAMEQLAMLLKTNQTGCVDTPNRILVPGAWVTGSGPLALKSRR